MEDKLDKIKREAEAEEAEVATELGTPMTRRRRELVDEKRCISSNTWRLRRAGDDDVDMAAGSTQMGPMMMQGVDSSQDRGERKATSNCNDGIKGMPREAMPLRTCCGMVATGGNSTNTGRKTPCSKETRFR